MPVNNLSSSKNAADVLLGQESTDAIAKRGYAVREQTAQGAVVHYPSGDQVNYRPPTAQDRATQGFTVRDSTGNRINYRPPSVGAVKATGLPVSSVVGANAVVSGSAELPVSSLANQYLTRAKAGINDTFGGASGTGKPDLSQLLPSELEHYQSLARLTGSAPTAEGAASYENLLPSERATLSATINAAKKTGPDLSGTGLTNTAIAGALRLAKAQETQ